MELSSLIKVLIVTLSILSLSIATYIIYMIFKKKEKYAQAESSNKTLSLHDMNLDQVIYELKLNLANPNPKDLTLMSEVNQQYRLRADQQKLILENLKNLVDINYEYINLKAIEILSDDILKFAIEDKKSTMANFLAIKAEKHNYQLSVLKSARELEELKVDAEKAVLRNIVADIKHKEADLVIKINQDEIETRKRNQDLFIELERHKFDLQKENTNLADNSNLIKEKIAYEKAKSIFINKVVDKVEIDKLPDGLKTYLIAILINSNANNPNDFERQQIINSFLSKQLDVELKQSEKDIEMKEQKVAQEKVVADDMKFKSDARRRDIEP